MQSHSWISLPIPLFKLLDARNRELEGGILHPSFRVYLGSEYLDRTVLPELLMILVHLCVSDK